MKIRRATVEDLHGINAVHSESTLGICATRYSAVELSQWTDTLRPDRYVALFAGREFIITEEGGKILGFYVLDLRESLINATYVDPKTVRRGIGRSLVEAVESAAKQGGVSQLHLNSILNAVPFYERLGYVQKRTAYNLQSPPDRR
jgi:GNAT superfamily N-acetyltransferase